MVQGVSWAGFRRVRCRVVLVIVFAASCLSLAYCYLAARKTNAACDQSHLFLVAIVPALLLGFAVSEMKRWPSAKFASKCGVRQNGTLSPEETCERIKTIIEHSRDLIWMLDRDGNFMFCNRAAEVVSGFRKEDYMGRSYELVVDRKEVGRLEDIRQRVLRGEMIEHELDLMSAYGKPIHLAVSVVPIYEGDNVVGTASFARDIGERKRLERQILMAGEREQRRLMSDLHDCMGQHLTGLAFYAKSVSRQLEELGAPVNDAQVLVSLTEETLTCAKDLVSGLYPPELDHGDLVNALRKLAEATHRVFDIPCIFEGEDCAISCNETIVLHLYRIAQEAVNNAVKHGGAKEIVISLASEGEPVGLVIEDDGVGVSGPSGDARGMGLRIMRYRSEWIGWRLEVVSREEGGTRVVCVRDNDVGLRERPRDDVE